MQIIQHQYFDVLIQRNVTTFAPVKDSFNWSIRGQLISNAILLLCWNLLRYSGIINDFLYYPIKFYMEISSGLS